MVSWVPVFTPDPGTVIKDMDIVGDHCVLTVRTNTNHLVLTVVPLMNPERVYTVKVREPFLHHGPVKCLKCFFTDRPLIKLIDRHKN